MHNDQVLLTSRIRLARNIEGYPYPSTMDREAARALTEKIIDAFEKREDTWVYHKIQDMAPLQSLYALEENRISPELMKNKEIGSYLEGPDNEIVMLMEEDHLRIQDMRKGFFLDEEYENVASIAGDLEERLPVSYDPVLGYLAACPSNVGTGLRAGCMMHLPALDTLGMEQIQRSITRMGFVLRGIRGEGSKSIGHIYQISNERTLGLTEEEFLRRAKSIVAEVAALERIKRKEMYLDHLIELEDMARRSYGILRNARIIGFEEVMFHLSHMKLGIELSVLDPKRDFDLYDAMIRLGKAHLQMERGSFLDDRSSNIYRANTVRKFIKEVF
ncbi:protein arginine kinase [Peptoniphilus ivorii]|uniref:hypothetical protein n=1 Tax=Aedoeadaptatus ivorii TaxID=54006 RepID=UPI002780DCAF|nr:hypothetical protein [Peptoniphilus ivorii]MDQ0508059.1 protein arginine kinase [Peptoniphilus ivorii]